MAINNLADKFVDATGVLRAKISDTLYVYSEVIAGLEQTVFFRPQDASFDLIGDLTRHVDTINKMVDQLSYYTRFYPSLRYYIDEVYDIQDELTVRFYKWSTRQLMSVKEYAQYCGKSVSTIYRWIKQGKLIAAKNPRGRWAIAV